MKLKFAFELALVKLSRRRIDKLPIAASSAPTQEFIDEMEPRDRIWIQGDPEDRLRSNQQLCRRYALGCTRTKCVSPHLWQAV